MTYFSFWAILSLVSSAMISFISGVILVIVAFLLINIPLFLFIYCSYKMGKSQKKIDDQQENTKEE